MGMHRRGGLTTAISAALASVAVFAQLLLLAAPLIEIHDVDVGARVVSAVLTSSHNVIAAGHENRTPAHNPTTCPACIAQSLHARVEQGVRLPTLLVASRTPPDVRAALLPHHDPPSTHHSRAPPTVA